MFSEELVIKLAKTMDRLLKQHPDTEKDLLSAIEKYLPKTYKYYEQYKNK